MMKNVENIRELYPFMRCFCVLDDVTNAFLDFSANLIKRSCNVLMLV